MAPQRKQPSGVEGQPRKHCWHHYSAGLSPREWREPTDPGGMAGILEPSRALRSVPQPFKRMRTRPSFTLSTTLTLFALAAASGCGSSATTVTSPSTLTRCAVTGSNSSQLPPQGGTGTVAVSAARECAWSASVEGQWLSIRNGATGQGEGAVEFAAAANPDPAIRRGAIVLNDSRVEVMQAAAECAYTLSESSRNFGQTGGPGAFDVRASSSLCTWAVQTDAPWIQLRSGTSGKGTAAVDFEIAPGTGVQRTGTITAAGLRFSVTQTAGCAYTVNPISHTVPSGGGQVTINVATTPACPWTASPQSPWITLTTPASASGAGAATFNVAATTSSRAGAVVVAGQTVAISQGALACSYTISPDSASIPASGGSGRVTVATASGCAWSASSTASWLEIVGAAAGRGNGEVTYQAGPSTSTRSATLTVAGRTFTVNQSAACSFSISPEQLNIAAAGGTSTVNVTAQNGCAWSMSSPVSWITLRANGPENGAGAVQVTVAANTGAARSATITIAGRTLSVSQAAQPVSSPPCTYRVGPLEIKANSDGALRRVEIETAEGCAWTASSNAGWIRVGPSTSGSGNGEVFLLVGENEGPERTGTVTIAGQTVTVTQKED